MNSIAIQTNSLTCDFNSIRAVDSLTLEIPRGIVFGFLGPNGAGKTTTIRLLLGLLKPSKGHAEVLGFDTSANADKVRERTGALLEHPGLYERLSAGDNLEYYGRVYRLPSAGRKARIRELLTHFGLWERRRDRVGSWSRGMKQKLAIARSLLHRPSLLFLDEPTAGLDPVAAAALRDNLSNLVSDEGLTVFLTTHNLHEAEKLCDLLGVINQGRLITVGHPDELRSRSGKTKAEVVGRGFAPKVVSLLQKNPDIAGLELVKDRLTIELNGTVSIAPIIRMMVTEGVEIEEVRKVRASLEEAFLKLMEESCDQ
ncbi:MAG: ABC transporter ATP-binding protein [Candidatus Latescibacteria bacterium]|nr:ABC transporter ATP-binding protein [Candidatus Latescibacterota bacterium]